MTTLADHVILTLQASGVTRRYGLPGDSLNGLTDAIRRAADFRRADFEAHVVGLARRERDGGTQRSSKYFAQSLRRVLFDGRKYLLARGDAAHG